jgi:iron complex outermembrane receptor protein
MWLVMRFLLPLLLATDGVELTQPRLLEQAELLYPPEAQGLHGDVTVLVEVDAQGLVVSAEVLSGPEAFHPAALEAAQALCFEPAQEDGLAVASSTRVHFHFEPPARSNPASMRLVVHAHDGDAEAPRLQSTVDQEALEQSAGQDFAVALERAVPGLVVASGTAASSKPILRGQTERRLVVMQDGVRHASQSWGPDHGTEINPFTAGEISVVRGAAAARYGADAVGGAIVVKPPPMRSAPGLGGRATAGWASNGLRPSLALTLDAVPEGAPKLSFRAHADGSMGRDLSTPSYVLANTASRQQNWALGAQALVPGGTVRVGWNHYGLDAGIFAGMQTASPAEFEALLALDAPPGSQDWQADWDIARASQKVRHDLWTLHGEQAGRWGEASVVYAFQRNRRQEYDRVRPGVEGAQYDFVLRTHSLDVRWQMPERDLGVWELDGSMGLQSAYQENVYTGYTLIPNFRALSGGVFVAQRLHARLLDLDVGLRYDALGRSTFLDPEEAARHEALPCESQGVLQRCDARYGGLSASMGVLVHIVPEHLDARFEAAKSTRNPSIDELYLVGVAPTLPLYTLGNPTLGQENTWTLNSSVGLRSTWVELEVAAYANHVQGYITQSQRLNGQEAAYKVTIRGAWPIVDNTAQDVNMAGLEGHVQLNPQGVVGVALMGSAIRAQGVDGSGVVGIPADRLRGELILRPRPLPWAQGPELGVSLLAVDQARGAGVQDVAAPPPGYALLGASLTSTVVVSERAFRVGVQANNLLNARYRDYNALLRPYADSPGRDVRLHLSTTF